jgi:mRNA interferase MazF
MSYERGDVVLVDYPFAEGMGSKVRPALVIQADVWNVRFASTLLVLITSRAPKGAYSAVSVPLAMTDPRFLGSGLQTSSYVCCHMIYTCKHERILSRLGHMAPGVMTDVDRGLRACLNLPSAMDDPSK